MSYQRAVVNCRRCFERAESIKCDAGTYAERRVINEKIATKNLSKETYKERDQAMQALEEEMNRAQLSLNLAITHSDNKGREVAKNSIKELSQALTACMNCKYEQAEIAEIFNPSDVCSKGGI